MEGENLLRRNHGGASLVYDKVIELSLNDRSRINPDAKARIAEMASMLLTEGDSIGVTSGSTIEAFVGLRCKTLCDVLYDTLGEFGTIQA